MTDDHRNDLAPLRIALDGTALSFPPSGIRTYVEALIAEFSQEPRHVTVSVLAPVSAQGRKMPAKLNRALWDIRGVAVAATGNDVLHIPHGSAPYRRSGPTVVTLHDLIPVTESAYRVSFLMRSFQYVMARSIPRAQAVIVPSQYVANQARDVLEISPERLHVIPMAAGPAFRPATHRDKLPDAIVALGVTGPYVFNVGGFDVRKNLPVLLEAFARFSHRVSEPFQLVIAGAPHTSNPHIYPPIDPVIDRLGLRNRVVVPGFISDDVKVALYQHAAMYVTPSLSEGFGMTALEAMACGTPVIATNTTSLPEVVGTSGILVPPHPEPVASAMTHIASSSDVAKHVGQSGLDRSKRFSWRETARQTAIVYQAVL